MTSQSSHVFKLILLGDSHVGKSAVLIRLTDNTFDENFSPTIGVDFKIYTTNRDNQTIKLQIWDTAGQERFRSLASTYFNGADGIIIFFDVTNIESFQHLNTWVQDSELHANESVKKLLVGNKCDMTAERVVDYDTAKNFADSLGIQYIETSAKNSTNIEQVFNNIVTELLLRTSTAPPTTSKIDDVSNLETVQNTNTNHANYDHLIKLLLVGDSGVGKSALLRRFTDDDFSNDFISTIGLDFMNRVIEHNGKTVKLRIWDTAGQERFRSMIKSYFRGTHGIIVVFDVTNAESFDNIKYWFDEINTNVDTTVMKLLVGNKCDLTANRIIQQDKAKKLADSLGVGYMETSAKTSNNVEQIFKTVAIDVISSLSPAEPQTVNVSAKPAPKSSNTSSGFC